MFATVMGLLVGCTGDGGATYTLALTPVTASSQAPFDGVDQLDLVLTPRVGDPLRLSLGAPESGSTPVLTGLPALDETRIVVEGFRDGELVLRGRTEPLTARDGTVEASVFVARTESTAWLGQLPEGVYLPLLLPLGDGRFFLGGGVAEARSGDLRKGNDLTRVLSLAPPDDGLAFVETGTLPEYVDAAGALQTERMGATATLLTVDGPDAGKFLVVGGAPSDTLLYSTQPAAAVALYDPASDSWEDLGEDVRLASPRSLHTAAENVLGNVVIYGGIGERLDDNSGVSLPSGFEVYDGATRALTAFFDEDSSGLGDTWVMSADLGAEGTLFCGGAILEGTGWSSSDKCVRVPLDGSSAEEVEALPAPLTGAAMVTLADGRVLLTGGASAPTNVANEEYEDARDSAWLYNPETDQWGRLSGSMSAPRAGHRVVALRDGRVAIIGGAQTFNPLEGGRESLSCIEVYDPVTSAFTPIDDCTADDDAGGLPGRASEIAVAYDPDYGVLLVSGLDEEGSAAPYVSLFVPRE